VVFLDQEGVEQAHAVVVAAAAAHGVLLRLAQARQGLARIEEAHRQRLQPPRRRRSAAHAVAVPGQGLQEVQRAALAP
jgi:hypothetical protein